MQTYKRIQEKKIARKTIAASYVEEREMMYEDYDDSAEYIEGCMCPDCVAMRVEILRQKYWEKHKNRPSSQSLETFFR